MTARRHPKKVIPEPVKHNFRTPVTEALLHDHGGGGIYDADRFTGSYTLAGPNGEVDFLRASGYARAAPFNFVEPYYLERAMLRMFLTIAKHTGRFVVVTETHLKRFFEVGTQPHPEERAFAGSRVRALMPGALNAPGIDADIGVAVFGLVENIGRVVCFGDKSYGVVVFDPTAIRAVQLVPTPYGMIDAKPERLPSLE